MSNVNDIHDSIYKAISIFFKSWIKELKFNRTEYGKITSVLGDAKYGVTINELESKIYAIDNKIFEIGDIVIIIIGNNSFNTDKYILAKRPY
jgi:3D (Asp-Asp-Asp) domain-containing protein